MRALIILDNDESPVMPALLAVLRDHALIPQVVALPEAGTAPDSIAAICSYAGLTARECQLVHLDLHGFSRREIAQHLGLAPTTVKTYWKTIYSKLGICRRSQLRAWLNAQQQRPAATLERAVGENPPHTGSDVSPFGG